MIKSLIFVAALATSPVWADSTATEKKETVRVCVEVKDRQGNVVIGKNGKPQERCRNVRKHKKLEGATEVPKK